MAVAQALQVYPYLCHEYSSSAAILSSFHTRLLRFLFFGNEVSIGRRATKVKVTSFIFNTFQEDYPCSRVTRSLVHWKSEGEARLAQSHLNQVYFPSLRKDGLDAFDKALKFLRIRSSLFCFNHNLSTFAEIFLGEMGKYSHIGRLRY